MEDIKQSEPSKIAPGTEGAAHTGLIEPHSEAANALPNGGASGVTSHEVADIATKAVATNMETTDGGQTATTEMVTDGNPLPKSQHPNDVKFKFNAKATDRGFAKDAVQVVSKETADHFTKIGIGSIVK